MEIETVTWKEEAGRLLKVLVDTAVETKEFLVEQIPPTIQELIHYYTFLHALWAVIGVLMYVLGRWSFNKITASQTKEEKYDPNYGMIGVRWVPLAVFGGIGAMVTIGNLIYLGKLVLAPRVWLIEYAAGLMK